MPHRRLRLALGALALLPLALSVAQRSAPVLVAPAAACTGAPIFSQDAVTLLPRDGSTAPRNARVWFLHDVARPPTMFATRPTEPALLRRGGEDVSILERTELALRPATLEPNTRYELWLPGGLPPPWGTDAGAAPSRALAFRTSDREDVTAPKLRVTGDAVVHPPGPTSCGPGQRLEIPVAVDDESDVVVEVIPAGALPEPARRPVYLVTAGRAWLWDVMSYEASGPVFATKIRLTPIDVAGNRGAPVDVDLHRASDGGAPGAEAKAAERAERWGCGKF